MNYLSLDSRKFFLLGMRLFFGLWLLYGGLVKWIVMGPKTFVGFIAVQFDPTWSPHLLNIFLGYLIMTAEPLLSLFLLSGKRPRLAWTLLSLLMFLLTIGQTILMKPDVVSNWQFLLMTLVCAALSEPEPVS